jgi:hypothetical protein
VSSVGIIKHGDIDAGGQVIEFILVDSQLKGRTINSGLSLKVLQPLEMASLQLPEVVGWEWTTRFI